MTHQESDFPAVVTAARAELGEPTRTRIVQGRVGEEPRFELYHAFMSVCSQKVRVVLAEKGVPYYSNEMAIASGKGVFSEEFSIAENYRPGYVRLRSYGAGSKLMANLATGHNMRSGVDTEGFDACVVPTLVDHQKRRVVVDSSRIIEYIDQQVPDSPLLIPVGAPTQAEVRRQVRIVDGIPMGGILYGFQKNDPRPEFMIAAMQDVYDNKRQAIEMLIEQNADDAELVRTYRAKIAKETAGKALYKNEPYLAANLKEFEALIHYLNADLHKSEGPWLCGPEFTMADAMWGVSLYRIHWIGHAWLWGELPRVREYAHRLYARPSIVSAIIEWPNPMPPSPHVADIKSLTGLRPSPTRKQWPGANLTHSIT